MSLAEDQFNLNNNTSFDRWGSIANKNPDPMKIYVQVDEYRHRIQRGIEEYLKETRGQVR